jgi:anti-sigma factor RsiW
MTCQDPVSWATLVDYWAGEQDELATVALEEHLFGCADCTATSARVAAVTEALRAAIPPVISRRRVDQLRARGTRVLENDFAPGERREVQFSPDADLLVHRLGGLDLTGAQRVGFQITAESTGALIATVEEAPFDPAEGAVLVACQRHYAAMPHDTVMAVSIHRPGAAARIATYTILHRFL